tara:strand:+ start:10504 stop:10698 length:195 start_codon:yes stop_codon:yes gene_type:complete
MFKITPVKKDSVTIDPENGKRLSSDGKIFKNVSTFWINRERDGDVTIIDMSITIKKGKNNVNSI